MSPRRRALKQPLQKDTCDGNRGFYRPGRDGLPDGRTPQDPRQARRAGLQQNVVQGGEMGGPVRRPGGGDACGSGRRRRFRVHLRRQRRRSALGHARRKRRLRRPEEGSDPHRQHDGLGGNRPRTGRRRPGARQRLPRRAGLRRPGRSRERRAHGHGRRRASGLRQGEAGDRLLRPDGRASWARPAQGSSPR